MAMTVRSGHAAAGAALVGVGLGGVLTGIVEMTKPNPSCTVPVGPITAGAGGVLALGGMLVGAGSTADWFVPVAAGVGGLLLGTALAAGAASAVSCPVTATGDLVLAGPRPPMSLIESAPYYDNASAIDTGEVSAPGLL